MEPYEAIWHMRPIRRGLRLHRDDEPVSRTDLFLVCRWCLPIVRDRIDARAADLPGHIARWAPPLIPLTGERRALVRRRYAAMLRPGVPGPPLEA
jgi:hypothetical protein